MKPRRNCTGPEKRVDKRVSGSFSTKNVALFGFLILAYFIAARLGVALALVQPYATPIWFPAGGAVVAFLLFGYRVWPAVFLGSFLGHLSTSGFIALTFVVPIGATIEGLLGAYLVNKFANGINAFDTAKDVFLFVLFACICAPSLNAAVGVGVNYFGGHSTLTASLYPVLTWWLAHSIGILLVAPFLVLSFRASHHRMNLREFAELTILLVGLLFVCMLVFGPLSVTWNSDQVIRAWLCVPFLIWAAFRFCPLEAAGTTMILFGTAIWGTLHGYGSFVSKNLTTSLVLLDSFVGVIGTMTLVVAAMVVERRRFEEELLGVHSLLHAEVDGKGRQLADTVQALEVEVAVHSETKKSLRANQERLELMTEETKGERSSQTAQTPRKRHEP
jgi:integral membrane sensor domain MASE1